MWYCHNNDGDDVIAFFLLLLNIKILLYVLRNEYSFTYSLTHNPVDGVLEYPSLPASDFFRSSFFSPFWCLSLIIITTLKDKSPVKILSVI